MKKNKILSAIIIFLCLVITLILIPSNNKYVATLDNVSNIDSTITSDEITVNNRYLDVTIGSTLQLDISSKTSIVSYETSNKYIATVSNTGLINGLKKGSCKITITNSSNVSKVVVVNVCPSPDSIDLVLNNTYVGQGDTIKYAVNVKPIGSNRNVTLTSSNKDVVINNDGTINIGSNVSGSVELVATTTNGLTSSKTINVMEYNDKSISLTNDNNIFFTKNAYTTEQEIEDSSKILRLSASEDVQYQSITIVCGKYNTDGFDTAPTYVIELNNLNINTAASNGILINPYGYVNIILRLNGDNTLISSTNVGLSVGSIQPDSIEMHVNITIESVEESSTLKIGSKNDLSTDTLGDIHFNLSNTTSYYFNDYNFYQDSTYNNDITKLKDILSDISNYKSYCDTENVVDLTFKNDLFNKVSFNTKEEMVKLYDNSNREQLEYTAYCNNKKYADYYNIESSDINVATISPKGANLKLDGEGYGVALISISFDSSKTNNKLNYIYDFVYTTVYAATQARIKIDNINTIYGDNYLIPNNEYQLSTSIVNETFDSDLLYESSDESVATIDSTGLINTHNPGNVTIRVIFEKNIDIYTEVNLTVVKEEESISLTNLESSTLFVNEDFDISKFIEVLPNDATNKTIKYTSSNTDVAEISETGLITPKVNGNVTITCTTINGKTVSYDFTVETKVESVEINSLDETKVIEKGQTFDISSYVSVLPETATNKTVTYSSRDESIARIDQNGLIIAKSRGNVEITITTIDQNKTCTQKIEVYVTETDIESDLEDITNIELGNTFDLSNHLNIIPLDATNKTLTYLSSNEVVATIDESGLITSVSCGSLIITVTSINNIIKTYNFNVKVSVTGVEINNLKDSNKIIEKGQTFDASSYVSVLPENATNKTVTYSSSDEAIATIDSTGLITTLHSGYFTITVTTLEGNFKASTRFECYATVSGLEVETPTKTNYSVNEQYQINAHVLPLDATNQGITYYSNSTNKATVDQNGLVTFTGTGNDDGAVTIEIRSKESNFVRTITFYVTLKVESVKLGNVSNKVLPIGNTLQLTYTLTPINATNKKVSFESSNTSIATVSATGLVTSKSSGSVTITIKTDDGNYSDSITLTCGPHVDSITIKNTDSILHIGSTLQLEVELSPIDAANQNYTYSSSNSTIATVSSTGLVTAMQVGTAVITVKTEDLAKEARIILNIKNIQDKPTEITKENVEVYNESIVILNPQTNVEYRLVDEIGNVVVDYTSSSINNKITFDNLSDNHTYVIEYRTKASAYKDASLSLSYSVTTNKNTYVKLPTYLIVLMIVGSLLVLGLIVFFIIKTKRKKRDI